ncbi:MAG: HlyD family efflux transporter periplasmic adaptor subunit, partial [Planktomarina sp.]|nr:HlyD family efflux transporter periplasmic adaptor subunit [Planktomarina sp.]
MDPTQNDGSGPKDYFMIFTVTIIFGVFLIWANYTHLDLVTRGGGRVIAAGQNKNIQSPERGSIASYMVEEGSVVKSGQIIATINPIEAAGVLEELEARLANLNIRLVRLDAELESKPISVVKKLSGEYSKSLVDAEVELMISRKASLDAELETLKQDRTKTIKMMLSLDAQISGRMVMQNLLIEEMKEVLPLVEAGALGSSERFRLERQDASIATELEVLSEEKGQAKVAIEQISNKTDAVKLDYKTNIYQERSEVIGEISELEARLPAIRQRLKQTEIRSPIDGIINRVFYNNVGAVVTAGQIVAEIVPTGGDVLIEAFIDPKDIATVEPGQKVKIS